MKSRETSTSPFTLRSVGIGLAFSFINIYWLVQRETVVYWNASHPTTISLFSNAVFSLLIITLLSASLRRISPKLGLSRGELLAIYAMMTTASSISGHGLMQVLPSLMGHPFWYASPENDWGGLFLAYIPRWLAVDDKRVLSGYYEGDSTLYEIEHIRAWIVPVLAWSGFVFALVFALLCINVLLSRRWIEEEKLSYPIVQLPYRLISNPVGIFKNRLLWIGIVISGAIDLLNGLNHLYPVIPGLRMKIQHVNIFTEKPWDALGAIPVSFYPFVIGLTFFIPLDLSFSCWFFFWFRKSQGVLGSIFGLSGTGFPFAGAQTAGAYIAICAIALWVSRHYLKGVMRKIIMGRKDPSDDSHEPMRYRFAALGLITGLLFILVFCYAAGMSFWVIVVFFLIFFALKIAITRMRAELGTPVHDFHNVGPDALLPRVVGVRPLGVRNLTMFSMFWFLNRAHYSDPMPHQLEAFKMADTMKIENKGLLRVLVLATIFAIPCFFWVFLHACYQTGMEKRVFWFGWESYNRLGAWLAYPLTPDSSTAYVGVGFLATVGIALMRSRFLWFILHPAGYAISDRWGMTVCWLPIFISWGIKLVLLKWGGLKTYRRATPLFLGLILGEFIVGITWEAIGLILGLDTYVFWFF